MTKLTLSVPEETVALARKKAKERGVSISAMFTEWIRAQGSEREGERSVAPLTRSVSGLISLPSDWDERQVLQDALSEKYGMS